VLSDDGNEVEGLSHLKPLRHGQDFTKGLAEDANLFFGALQQLGIQPEMGALQTPSALPGATSLATRQKIPVRAVQFITPFAPWDMTFNDIPGLRLTSIRQTDQGWLVTGEIYGR
jgi:hypothetical protein